MLHIDPIETNDIEELAVLYRQLAEHEPNIEKMQQALLEASSNKNHILLGAKDEQGQLIGSCAAVVCQTLVGKCRPFMVVEDVIVKHSARRTGVGRALMTEIESYARERECSYIFLLTDTDRPDAQRFYLSLGYHSDAYRGFKKTLSSNT